MGGAGKEIVKTYEDLPVWQKLLCK